MRIIAATQNQHKIDEIKAITTEFGMDIISRNEAGIPDFEIVYLHPDNGRILVSPELIYRSNIIIPY